MSSVPGDMSEKAGGSGEGTTETQSPKRILKDFLLERVPVFRKLIELKERGWQNPAGDVHFRKQRERADNADRNSQRKLFNMMIQIGNELNAATGAFAELGIGEDGDGNESINVLDLCMAPGGFTASLLRHCPEARVSGMSLPNFLGGHKMLTRYGDKDPRVTVKFLDITTLIADLYPSSPDSETSDSRGKASTIPTRKPQFANSRPYFTTPPKFNLAFCDGQVLRTHHPNLPKNSLEPVRLLCAQLVVALTRLRSGGRLVILLHKADAWNSARLIQTVDSFCTEPIQLFKPVRKHATRGSFYLVAKGVQPDHPEAKKAVDTWRRVWRAATLRLEKDGDRDGEEEEDRGWNVWEGENDVHKFLEAFGDRFIELATPIWKIQADALEKAPYVRNSLEGEK